MSIQDGKQKLVVILGPTASGKSDLAVALAKKIALSKTEWPSGAEIISADSRQVYRGMNLGTGKITKKEMALIPHHLLDVASPKRRFSAAQYKKSAQLAIRQIIKQKKLPIVCGGTGFYIDALTGNVFIPEVKPDLKLRAQLEKKSTGELFKILKQLNPERAANIDPQNPRRLVRAIEIVKTTGRPVPKPKIEEFFDTLFLGIRKLPKELKERIAHRLKKRFKQGMIKEVEELKKIGLSWKRLESFGLEYRWIARFLQNKISRKEMISRLQKEIEHYAKRQMTWFKKNKKIAWVKNKTEALKIVNKFLKK